MKKGSQLTAKNFIKSSIQRQKYQCWICYQVCIKPVLCQGGCGHIFCMKCVSDTRNNNNDRCPSRCSEPFLVQPLPEIEAEFFCPFNPTECTIGIYSVLQFDNHYKRCRYVPKETLESKRLQNEYRCVKNHHLEFYVGSYQQMLASMCTECQESKLCRSFCRICQVKYCVDCRVPPCSKQGCPIGHEFTFQKTEVINFICDICGISTAVSNGGVFDDSLCNFGICELCFNQLPEKYDESKPRAIVANINTECSCKEILTMVNIVGLKQVCQLCHKQKECPKKCLECNKHYCLDCKLVDIYSDKTCLTDHQYHLVKKQEMGQLELGCMKCGHHEEEYYIDQHCFVKLCEKCLVYSMQVTTDKERPIPIKCNQGHVLHYFRDEDTVDQCCQCSKVKFIKLACTICAEMYCYQCKPIPLQTCYFQHGLKEVIEHAYRECQFCQQKGKRFMNCAKCSLYVCHGCVQKTLEVELQEDSSGSRMDIESEVMEMEESDLSL